MNDTDKKVRQLFGVVQGKKEEIAKIEKPNWVTNCNFSYDPTETGLQSQSNLATVRTPEEVVRMAAFLTAKRDSHVSACEALETEVPFKWGGYKYEDWVTDFKTRLDKINISAKKKELAKLEARLDAILSPELKRELELEAITAALEE